MALSIRIRDINVSALLLLTCRWRAICEFTKYDKNKLQRFAKHCYKEVPVSSVFSICRYDWINL